MSIDTAPTTLRSGLTYPEAARDHLWMHFTRQSTFEPVQAGGLGADVPIIVRGKGHLIYDDRGREYIDGLAGLFVVQVGHGRDELAEAAARQARELAFFPLWSYAHPRAIELADRLAAYAPGDLNRVFFTTGGGEAVETAWKLAKQYYRLTGRPGKHKVISRSIAYHGTPQGALSITGIPGARAPFEPLVPGAFKVPNTNQYRAPEHLRDDEEAFGLWAADRIASIPIVQPLSGAALLVLLAGWPLAIPALAGTALITMAMGGLDAAEALEKVRRLLGAGGALVFRGGRGVLSGHGRLGSGQATGACGLYAKYGSSARL